MIYNQDCIQGAYILEDNSVDLIIADPPYNLAFGGTTQTRTKKPRFKVIVNDDLTASEYQKFNINWLSQAYRILKPGRHIYVCIDWRMYPQMSIWMQHIGFTIKNCIVWDKVNMGLGWQYRFSHEFIIFATKGQKIRRISTRSAKDIWSIARIPGNQTIHPTEKPVQLIEKMILNSTEENELVVDMFSGSGSAGEATLKLNRKLVAFEIDPHWFNISAERLNKYTLE